MADTADLKSASFGSAGSIPAPDTSFSRIAIVKSKLRLDKSLICPPEFFLFTFFFFALQKWRCSPCNGVAFTSFGTSSLRSSSIPAPDTSYFSFYGKRKVTKRKTRCRRLPMANLDRRFLKKLGKTPVWYDSKQEFLFLRKKKSNQKCGTPLSCLDRTA